MLISTLCQQHLGPGLHSRLQLGADNPTGIGFSLLHVPAGESFVVDSPGNETALILIHGKGFGEIRHERVAFARTGWRHEKPTTFYLTSNDSLLLVSTVDCRFALVRAAQRSSTSTTRLFLPQDVSEEQRGLGILEDTSHRLVRTICDRTSAPDASLVLGEVVNFPGRWSSYPPHFHSQDEVYYYEFDPVDGFGFGQCGDDVATIRHQDLLLIPGGKVHAQVSAPGFHLYYIWAIRHGDVDPYTGFTYSATFERLVRNT